MRLLSVIFLALLLAACSWQPSCYCDNTQLSTEQAVASFRTSGELAQYFDEAVAWAVFPSSFRAGTGFGGAYGTGWLFEQDAVTGRVMMVEVFAGANLGAQGYRSILFFRNEMVLERFRRGRFEFTGQAHATVVTAGKSLTPSYHQDVAMFVQVKGGLLLEASVGTQRYDFFPLPEAVASQAR
jgi:lipid-binding SYLF domain-containing protein